MVLCGVEPPPLVLSVSALIVRARFPALAPLPPLLVGTRQLTDGLDTAANEEGSEVEPEVEPEFRVVTGEVDGELLQLSFDALRKHA